MRFSDFDYMLPDSKSIRLIPRYVKFLDDAPRLQYEVSFMLAGSRQQVLKNRNILDMITKDMKIPEHEGLPKRIKLKKTSNTECVAEMAALRVNWPSGLSVTNNKETVYTCK